MAIVIVLVMLLEMATVTNKVVGFTTTMTAQTRPDQVPLQWQLRELFEILGQGLEGRWGTLDDTRRSV